MERLFGLPTGDLAAAVTAVVLVLLALLGVLAVRNRVLLRLGLRNATRRPGRTALIVAGLMLGTAIVSSALATGDIVAASIRSAALESLGRTDEIVAVRGADVNVETRLAEAPRTAYLDAAAAADVAAALARDGLADGVTAAIVEPVAVTDTTSRRSEPRVTMFAPDPRRMAGFGELRDVRGGTVTLAALREGEVYLDDEAAAELDARPGDRLWVFVLGRTVPATVRAVVRFDGAQTDGAALLLPLARAQALLEVGDRASHVLVSNVPGVSAGEVAAALLSVTSARGLETRAAREDLLEEADTRGSGFISLFSTFGTFSIAAGILLTFLVFVMLAAERRSELGVARAIGTRRGHLVQMYLFEGVAYDLAAAAVGALLGVAVAWAMVFVLDSFMQEAGLEVVRTVRAQSVVLAYGLGVLITFVVVALSSWRVSRLTIAAAVRNLPEPPPPRAGRRRAVLGGVAVVLGVLLALQGRSSAEAMPFQLGVALVIVGVVPLVRLAGAPARVASTVGGLALVVWWLLPTEALDALAGGELALDPSIFVVGGLMVVIGAAWTIVVNADVLLGAAMLVLGRIRPLTPVLKMAMAYPLRARFRTGVTLAMFMLVVFTMVTGAATSGSFIAAFDDVEGFGGGFDVRASAAPASPVPSMPIAVRLDPGLDRDVEAVATQSYVPVDARQEGAGRGWAAYPLRGLDDTFLRRTTFRFAALARGYASDREVWDALRRRHDLAVVDAFTAPRRSNWSFGGGEGFRVSGFYLDDGTFEPFRVDVHDAASGGLRTLTVIGVLSDDAPLAMAGISTAQEGVERAFGARGRAGVFYFVLRDGADPALVADRLEARFLANGLDAQTIREVLDEAVGASYTVSWLIQAFMALGLVVGVAALGVVSARAVVERRSHIGVLRAIGFRRGMVELAFLLESSFVALTAILVGTALGLVVAWNVVEDAASSRNYASVHLVVPWGTLAVVFAIVYAVALLATLAPARRAARIAPASALRYQ